VNSTRPASSRARRATFPLPEGLTSFSSRVPAAVPSVIQARGHSAVLGDEQHPAAAERGEAGRLPAGAPGIDVADQHGAGLGAVRGPELDAVRAVIGREEDEGRHGCVSSGGTRAAFPRRNLAELQ
jgi:hypothetical protein